MIKINSLKDSIGFLNSLLNNLVCAVFVLNKEIKLQSVNDPFKALFHKEEEQAIGELCGNAIGCSFVVEESSICGHTANCGGCILRHSLIKAFHEKEYPIKESISRKFYIDDIPIQKHFLFTVKYVTYDDNDLLMVIFEDVTELKELNFKLERMAVTDSLTDLYNHKTIYQKLEEEIQHLKRYSFPISAVMFDIDKFKTINDIFGHPAGDSAIAAVSKIIKTNCRDTDIAGRYGGEEFLIVLPHTDLESAVKIGEHIRKSVESAKIDGITRPVTISGGVTALQSPMDNAANFIDRIDKLLLRAKMYGRNNIQAE